MKRFMGTFRFINIAFLILVASYNPADANPLHALLSSLVFPAHASGPTRSANPRTPPPPPPPPPLPPPPPSPPLLPSSPPPALSPTFHQPPAPMKFGIKPMVYILTSILSGLVVLGLVFILIFWHNKSRAVKPLEASWNGQPKASSIGGVQLFKRSELESACESFSNIVGSVSDGPLYKGTLPSGIEISVSFIKRDKALCRLSEAQFLEKISILSKVNHQNFVNLLGYCEEPLTRMVVFEYAPNGTLFEHLHVRESFCLGWAARMRIAMGVAYCLDYMHQLNPPIILKNLDTSLIYLTDDYAAKIADFELLSRMVEDGTGVGSSMALLQEEVQDKGSIVQKFGIVLLELLSGRDPNFEHSGPTDIWAWDLLKVDTPLKDMMDPELKSFPEVRAAAVFQLIKQCLNPNSEQVPSMKEVIAQLKEITGISPKSAAPLGYDLEIVSEGTT